MLVGRTCFFCAAALAWNKSRLCDWLVSWNMARKSLSKSNSVRKKPNWKDIQIGDMIYVSNYSGWCLHAKNNYSKASREYKHHFTGWFLVVDLEYLTPQETKIFPTSEDRSIRLELYCSETPSFWGQDYVYLNREYDHQTILLKHIPSQV